MKIPPRLGHISNLEFIRVLTPYVFTCQIVRDNTVLDIGCGFGHGTWLLASKGAQQVVSIDLDKKKTIQVNEFCCNFRSCGTLVMDAQRLGFRDHSFQMVTCFEVLEHIPDTDLFLSEIGRILKKDGIVLLTTPNRALRLLPFQSPWNPEHFQEHTLQSLRRILRRHFPFFEFCGIHGEPSFHNYYRKIWRRNSLKSSVSSIMEIIRTSVPSPAKRWIMKQLGYDNLKGSGLSYPDLLNMAVPIPDPGHWPFFVNDVNKHCLNFFVICGFDEKNIQRSVNKIKNRYEA
jgi:ubiquinone/menaquinone biosynthesis C-methylase UbiE